MKSLLLLAFLSLPLACESKAARADTAPAPAASPRAVTPESVERRSQDEPDTGVMSRAQLEKELDSLERELTQGRGLDDGAAVPISRP